MPGAELRTPRSSIFKEGQPVKKESKLNYVVKRTHIGWKTMKQSKAMAIGKVRGRLPQDREVL